MIVQFSIELEKLLAEKEKEIVILQEKILSLKEQLWNVKMEPSNRKGRDKMHSLF